MADSDSPARNGRHEALPPRTVNLPDVAWISARDGTRAPGDLEDLAARYHPGRHELTINSDFRAISDLIARWWCQRYRGAPGARTIIEGQVREWCEQILVEVILAVRNSAWTQEQLDALLSPTSFTAALLPRQLLHATLQKRLAQKLGPPRAPIKSLNAAAWCIRSGSPCQGARHEQLRRTPASRSTPTRGRQLAAELEQRFARDAELAAGSTTRTSAFTLPAIGCGRDCIPTERQIPYEFEGFYSRRWVDAGHVRKQMSPIARVTTRGPQGVR